MHESPRSRRVADLIQRELAQLIRDEIKDPRLGMVTVIAVKVSKDLGYAKVYVTTMDEADREISVEILNRAAGFLRHALGDRIDLRTMPSLRFLYDESIERASRLEALIEQARHEDQRKAGHPSDDEEPNG